MHKNDMLGKSYIYCYLGDDTHLYICIILTTEITSIINSYIPPLYVLRLDEGCLSVLVVLENYP